MHIPFILTSVLDMFEEEFDVVDNSSSENELD